MCIRDRHLAELVNEVRNNLTDLIDVETSQINYGELPVVYTSRMGLVLIFKNLLENAAKFKSNKPLEIEIYGKSNGSESLIYIRDNGIGIGKEHWGKVFNLFNRLDHGLKGSGVGLSISKKTAIKLNGDLKIENSSPENGTSFVLTLKNEI